MNRFKWLALSLLTLAAGALLVSIQPTVAQSSRTFPETGKSISGRFLEYWLGNGGLAQQGYPISDEMQETSIIDGKTYTVQYFERAVFEKHPENPAPYDVLLSLLGTLLYQKNYPTGAPGQQASTDNPRYFAETGKAIGGQFRTYWESHGGLAQQGYPISNEFQEKSATDGKTYTVQYFERAVFELHTENPAPFNVLLSLLGRFSYDAKYGSSTTKPTVTPTAPSASSTPTTTPTNTATATITPTPLPPTATPAGQLFFYNASSGLGTTIRLELDSSINILRSNTDFKTGWTTVTGIGHHLVLFYRKSTGESQIGREDDSGNINIIVKDLYYGAGYDIITSTLDGTTFFYKLGGTTLQIITFDADGKYLKGFNSTNVSPLWTKIIPQGYDRVMFYDQNTGSALVDRVMADDTLESVGALNFTKGLTEIVWASRGATVFYSAVTGQLSTGSIDFNGHFTSLYPPTVTRTGATNLITVGDYIFFYSTDGNGAAYKVVDGIPVVGDGYSGLGSWSSVVNIK